MKNQRSVLLAFLLVLFLSGSAIAQPEIELYGIAEKTINEEIAAQIEYAKLYQINYVTAAAALVGPIEGFRQCTGLDFHPATNDLYAVCLPVEPRDEESKAQAPGQVLVRLDRFTGEGTLITALAPPLEGDRITDISFRSDGVLFAHLLSRLRKASEEEVSAMDPGVEGNYTGVIDMQTGVIDMVGPTGYEDRFSGIAFSLADLLYHGVDDEVEPAINVLSQTTGAPIVSRPMIYPAEFGGREMVTSMDTMPISGDLYAIIYTEEKIDRISDFGVTSEIVELPASALSIINPLTGGVEAVGDTVEPMTAIAFLNKERELNVPTISEYGAVATVALLLGIAVIFLRRRQIKLSE